MLVGAGQIDAELLAAGRSGRTVIATRHPRDAAAAEFAAVQRAATILSRQAAHRRRRAGEVAAVRPGWAPEVAGAAVLQIVEKRADSAAAMRERVARGATGPAVLDVAGDIDAGPGATLPAGGAGLAAAAAVGLVGLQVDAAGGAIGRLAARLSARARLTRAVDARLPGRTDDGAGPAMVRIAAKNVDARPTAAAAAGAQRATARLAVATMRRIAAQIDAHAAAEMLAGRAFLLAGVRRQDIAGRPSDAAQREGDDPRQAAKGAPAGGRAAEGTRETVKGLRVHRRSLHGAGSRMRMTDRRNRLQHTPGHFIRQSSSPQFFTLYSS